MRTATTVLLCFQASAVLSASAQDAGKNQDSCCSTDADCAALMNNNQKSYGRRYGKALKCDVGCPGLINCNMFGLCQQCRGCFMTCDGANVYMEETLAMEDSINFCDNGEVTHISECFAVPGGASGHGSGSGSAASSMLSGSGGASGGVSGGGSGTGTASGANNVTASSGSGSASGGASGGGKNGSGSASGGASGGGKSGSGSASGGGGAAGGGSGSASGSWNRDTDVAGCMCGDDASVLEPGEAEFLCDSGKSMYCDAECAPGSDPADRLFDDMGGLWCGPFGLEGCRLCRFDCAEYVDKYCVPCPPNAQDWCAL